MLPNLTANEARVIGCLMEKSVVTPDQYPLTLSALSNACNQKSARSPIMSLEMGIVQHTVRDLQASHLVQVEENFKSGVEKYRQRFCNSTFGNYQFDPPQFAIVCLLLLRGPQTPGEIRARSGRMHAFDDNAVVVDAITSLIEQQNDPFVVKLPRTPGRKDSEYMHLFSGPVDVETLDRAMPAETTGRVSVSELAQRVATLEEKVDELKEQLKQFQNRG